MSSSPTSLWVQQPSHAAIPVPCQIPASRLETTDSRLTPSHVGGLDGGAPERREEKGGRSQLLGICQKMLRWINAGSGRGHLMDTRACPLLSSWCQPSHPNWRGMCSACRPPARVCETAAVAWLTLPFAIPAVAVSWLVPIAGCSAPSAKTCSGSSQDLRSSTWVGAHTLPTQSCQGRIGQADPAFFRVLTCSMRDSRRCILRASRLRDAPTPSLPPPLPSWLKPAAHPSDAATYLRDRPSLGRKPDFILPSL